MMRRRQLFFFVVSGAVSAIAHYGVLIALVEGARLHPVPATLCGYLAGGVVSYALNRRLTFVSRRAHREAMWRFAIVAGVGLGLTGLMMALFTSRLGLPYLPAQLLTTVVVLVWSFLAHKLWTFGEATPL